MGKHLLGKSVLEAAKERISFTFDNFERIYLSLSGGKDSTVMFHLVIDEAIKRNRKIGIFLLDWECQFEMTIEHIDHLVSKYSDNIELYWRSEERRVGKECRSRLSTYRYKKKSKNTEQDV